MSNSSNLNFNSEVSYDLEPFFKLTPDLLCIAGYDGYFKEINPAVPDTLGYSREELFSRPINSFVYPEDQDITDRYRDNLRENIPLINFENRYVTKEGDIVWLSWTSIPSPEDELIYAIAKDVTYKKEVEDKRNSLITNLTQINKNLKQLTMSTSHDLRTPVSNLVSVFRMLDTSKVQDEETAEFIKMLKSATDNLRTTLDNYVDELTHKDSLSVSITELNLLHTFDRIRESISSLIGDSGAVFEVDFSAFGEVYFNKTYLESIFLNLITNSIKYSKPDLPPVISIRTRLRDGQKQLIFADNGLGFDMNKVGNRIFELHQKFHNHVDSKGVGLYLVYNHITGLGGHIEVDSRVNQGTTFTITFRD
ncbi:MAG TPA: PAS domain-containing sensor histidine kinase [Balneolaceae bacterium]|nr:PAS domain-containing sensor histidine kinase [Balneolaceae bacterium]